MNIVKPIFEFLLWDNCNNNCKFCFQRKNSNILTSQQQKHKLDMVIKFLESDDYLKNSHILLVGGEIFDDIRRQDMLICFFNSLIKKLKSDIDLIDLIYINTNLLFSYDTMKCTLFPVLSIFSEAGEKIFNKLRIATSFDLCGRFKNQIYLDMFFENMKNIHDKFSYLDIVTNVILTDGLCNAILTDQFDPISFMKSHITKINFIPYIILDKQLAAPREKIFRALQHVNDRDQTFFREWLINIDLKQPRRMFYAHAGDNKFTSCECNNDICGHSENFKLYSSSQTCFVCDVKTYFNSIL